MVGEEHGLMAWVVGVTIAVDADNVPEKVKAPGFVEVLAQLVLQVADGVGLKGVSDAGGGAAEAAPGHCCLVGALRHSRVAALSKREQLREARRQQWVMRRYDSGHLDITGNEGSVGMVSPATKAKATVAEGHEGKLATVLR